MSTVEEIERVCDAVKALLISKNHAYGDSVMNPVRIFSKADVEEQIGVRIDDKLSRLLRGHEHGHDDTVFDLTGYLILLMVARGVGKTDEQLLAEEDVDLTPVPSSMVRLMDKDGDTWQLDLAGGWWLVRGERLIGDPQNDSQPFTREYIEREYGPLVELKQ